MAVEKRVICPERVRRVPRQFSWIDQRLVWGRYTERLSAEALSLYLFLVTVGDAKGLSYYSDRRVVELLPLEPAALSAARGELLTAGLVAYQRPFSQVLSLEPLREPQRAPEPRALQRRRSELKPVGEILRAALTGGGHR